MKNVVFWKNPGYKGHPTLKKDISCDVLIVGGGVTGVSLAYFLAKAHKNVVLVERDTIASGATGKAAGSVVLKGELDIKQIMDIYGEKKGRQYWSANHEGLELLKHTITKEHIKCDYEPEDTIYGSAYRRTDLAVFEEYAVEQEIEHATQLLRGKELKKEINTPLFKYAILSKHHGISVNPLACTQNLSVAAKRRGAHIFEHTPMLNIKGNVAKTPSGTITFKHIVMAIDTSIKSSAIRKICSTILVTRPLTHRELASIGMVPKKIVWDSKDIYHYFKLTKDNRILLGYGDKVVEKHHKGIKLHKPHFVRTVAFLKKLFPQIKPRVEYAWTASFGATANKLPYIKQTGHTTVVGGAASQVVCVMTARHIADLLLHKKSKLDLFFSK